MKKIILSFLVLISFTDFLQADQLAYITKELAGKGAAFIKSQREVLIFCGCCENDPGIYLKVTDAVVRHTGYENYYEIIITGINRDKEKITVDADLAYVHVNRNGKAVAVCVMLDLECDPCATDLKWDNSKN